MEIHNSSSATLLYLYGRYYILYFVHSRMFDCFLLADFFMLLAGSVKLLSPSVSKVIICFSINVIHSTKVFADALGYFETPATSYD